MDNLKVGDRLDVNFEFKNGYGPHALVDGDYQRHVVYQDYRDNTPINQGDIHTCEVTHVCDRVIRRYGVPHVKVYVKSLGCVLDAATRKERGYYFRTQFRSYFPDRILKHRLLGEYKVSYRPYTFAKFLLEEQYILGEVSKQDLDSIFRKELWEID